MAAAELGGFLDVVRITNRVSAIDCLKPGDYLRIVHIQIGKIAGKREMR